VQQQERLLNLRLLTEIDAHTFSAKSTELRDREAKLRLSVEVLSRGRHENADIAVKAFELSQAIRQKWLTADTWQAPPPGNSLFELPTRRRNSGRGNEKTLRRSRRRAHC
jgi:hypothetical protein